MNILWNMLEIKEKCIVFRGDNDDNLPLREDYEISFNPYLVKHPELQMLLQVKVQKRNNVRGSNTDIQSEYEPIKDFEVVLTQEDHYLKYDDEEYSPKDFVSVSLYKKLGIEAYCDVVGVKL